MAAFVPSPGYRYPISTCRFAPAFVTGASVCASVPTWFSTSFRQSEMFFTVTGIAAPPVNVSFTPDEANTTPVVAFPQTPLLALESAGKLLTPNRPCFGVTVAHQKNGGITDG